MFKSFVEGGDTLASYTPALPARRVFGLVIEPNRKTKTVKKVVEVWGKTYEVILSKTAKKEWTATGEYFGDVFFEVERSAGAALKRWKEAATCSDYYRKARAAA